MSDKKERKRELILDTAFDLILENGYSNTKIIDIANKAGIGKGTVYEYFESKEALILELIDKRVRRDYAKVCEAMDKVPACTEKLTEYFRLEIKTTAKYKINVNDLQNELTNNDTEISIDVLNAVRGIFYLQFEAVLNVIKKGIASGEFRNVDPYMASACFMGSISFYLTLLQQGVICDESEGREHARSSDSESSFLDCVFGGLLA